MAAYDDTGAARGLDLRGLFDILMRRKLLVLLPIVLGGTIAFASASLSPPTYTATAVLVANGPQVEAIKFDSGERERQGGAHLSSELDIIGSRLIADRVAARLREEMPPPAIVAQNPFAALATKALSGVERMTGLDIELPDWLLAFHADQPAAGPAYPTGAQLAKGVRVGNNGRSYTVHIAYTSTDPELSAAVANGFADEYLRHQVDTRVLAARDASDWLAHRLKDLRGDLEASELALEHFKATHGLDSEREAPDAAEVTSLRADLTQVRSEQMAVSTRLATLRSGLTSPAQLGAAAEGMGSPLLNTLRQQEAQTRLRLAELLNRATPRHPEVQPLRNTLADLQNQIRQEINRVISRLEVEQAALSAREGSIEQAIAARLQGQGDDGAATVGFQQLKREAEANRAIYETFLTRYKEMIEQARVQEPDARIISRADATGIPVQSKVLPSVLIGLFGGGVAGIGLAFGREHFSRPLKVDEAERLTGLPVLGVLPNIRSARRRGAEEIVARDPFSAYGDALRAVHITLQRHTDLPFLSERGQCRVIMVTSAVPQEGKSSFCFSLARVLSRDGLRVLLLDADMRASRLRDTVGNTKGPDLIDVLQHKAAMDDALRMDRPSGAHYLGARIACANPQTVLASEAFKDLLALARLKYDLVIIDTPPITAVTDAALIADQADTRLFVVRGNSTSRDLALAGLRILGLSKVKIDGLIFSRVNGMRQYRWRPSRYYGAGRILIENRSPYDGGATA